jgi:hypothetical protein
LETDPAKEVREQIARCLRVPEEQVHSTLDGNVVVVTVKGELPGRSSRNAMRRRQLAVRVAKRTIRNRDLELSITFAVRDSISAIEELVRKTTEFVLGHAPEIVQLDIERSGRTSVIVALAKTEDGTETKLTQVIAPLLQSAGLSLSAVTLVSPMREDVSDARLLRAAKVLSPCDAAAVARRLKHLDNIEISADLVHRRLDALRQKGLLVYLGDRRFALTLNGLTSVPTSTRRRNSSDIDRVLALARSKW